MATFISLNDAHDLTTNYRNGKENMLITALRNQGILPICETFDCSQVQQLIDQTDCASLRIYPCMGSDLKMRLIIVGVDGHGNDILPSGSEKILEEGQRCPTICPSSSPLNS